MPHAKNPNKKADKVLSNLDTFNPNAKDEASIPLLILEPIFSEVAENNEAAKKALKAMREAREMGTIEQSKEKA